MLITRMPKSPLHLIDTNPQPVYPYPAHKAMSLSGLHILGLIGIDRYLHPRACAQTGRQVTEATWLTQNRSMLS